MTTDFESALNNAADPEWRTKIDKATDQIVAVEKELEAEVYAACFATPAGKLVLSELNRLFCHGTRWVPGESDAMGYYREGSAIVVYHLNAKCEEAYDDPDDEVAET